jgi:hypothetical protein
MPPGPLRQALEDFIATTPLPPRTLSWKERVDARGAECSALVVAMWNKSKVTSILLSIVLGILTLLYSWTGAQPLKDLIIQLCNSNITEALETVVVDAMKTVFTDPAIAGMAQVYGAAVVDPVLNILENHAGAQDGDPMDFLRAISGLGIELNVAGGLVDTLTQAATGGVVTGFGEFFSRMYQATGFSHAGWHTSQTFLGATLLPRLERYYSEKYRPRRFSASELRDLYALGELNPTEMRIAARSLGWREGDIEQWIKLAFKTLSESDVWDALHKGYKDWNWATSRLRALGYDPADIPLLAQLNPMPPVNELTDVSKSTARAAYREGLISADQLRQYLDVLKVKPEEIELIIHLEDLTRESANKRLSVGQVKSAWTSNVITDAEAKHWLSLAGFPTEQINVLLATWRAEIAPTFLKVNSGTVIGAYVEHIYNRVQAHDKLVSIGFSPEDATLELDLAELRNPEAFQPPAPPPAKLLTPGVLSELVYYGLMNPAQMQARLVELGYTDADATLLSEAARIRALPEPKPLPYASIANAYVAGIITRDIARSRFTALGYTGANADIILATIEHDNPEAFGALPEVRMKQLTEGTLVDLTVSGVITVNELRMRLAELNYAQGDIDLIVARVAQLMAPVVKVLTESTVTRAYLAGVLTREATLARLIAMAYTPEDAEKVVATVEFENPPVFEPELVQAVRLPSIAALVAAVQDLLITEAEYLARCQEIGYSPEDAMLYLALATKNERKSTVQLSPSQIVAAYGKGLYSFGQSLGLLAQRGYSDGDATMLLRIQKDSVVNTEAWYGLLTGALTFSDVLTQLINAHYNDQDIVNAFGSLPPATLSALGVKIDELKQFLAGYPGGQ